MAITVELPADEEEVFRLALGDDLGQAAREAMMIEAYRRGRMSVGKLAELLGFETTHEADEWLAQHGVPSNYSPADYEADARTLGSWRITGDQ